MAKSRSIGGIYASLSLRDKGFRDGIQRAKSSIKEISGMGGGVGGLAAGLGAVTAAFGAMNLAMRGVLESYAEYDSLARGLKLLDGTAAATEERLSKLRDMAKAPGLGFEEVIQGDIRLRSAGLSADMSAKAIKGFGNALASVGGSKDDLKGVFLALGQISAKGKVSAEEINQLAERIPQIRKIMQDAFGTADTEAIQKMGIDSKMFIGQIINELDKLPKAMGGVQNDLDNYADAWKSVKTQASEFGLLIAGPWIKDISLSFTQARKDLEWLKSALGMKTPGLTGKSGKTENERYSDQAMADTLKAANEARIAENKVHNQNVMFWEEKEQERTAFLKAESEKRLAIEEETNKSKLKAIASYNEESGILTAKLSGDNERLKALEREKAIREKIAELTQSGFSEKEARKPAEAMVDAYIKLEGKDSPRMSPRDVNAYQARGLSLDGNNAGRAVETTNTLLGKIKDILSDAKKTGGLKF
jgi:tape measure domain-containing protein